MSCACVHLIRQKTGKYLKILSGNKSLSLEKVQKGKEDKVKDYHLLVYLVSSTKQITLKLRHDCPFCRHTS